jgi:hypothetical protein
MFFEKTELYVLVLQAPWHGYPDCLGEFEVYGLTGGISIGPVNPVNPVKPVNPVNDIGPEQKTPLTIPEYSSTASNYTSESPQVRSGKYDMTIVGGIVAVIFVIFIAVMLIKN